MISAKEFEDLVDELLDIERRLDELGDVVIETGEGPYRMRERAFANTVPAQKAYNDLYWQYHKKKQLVEAFDMVARYKLAMA